jgi:cytochrome c551/c552
MRSWATVQPRADFLKWVKSRGSGGSSTGNGAAGGTNGKQLFVDNGCNGCHTFKAANATGTVGPDLDKLAQYAQQAGQPLDQFIRESIVKPSAYIQPGFPNAMPATFAALPKTQIDALVKFLSQGAQ